MELRCRTVETTKRQLVAATSLACSRLKDLRDGGNDVNGSDRQWRNLHRMSRVDPECAEED